MEILNPILCNRTKTDGSEYDLSLIIPVYKNEETINDLLLALSIFEKGLAVSMEVVFVVDGSPDNSYLLLSAALPLTSFSSQLVLLSRNFGSFAAIRQGMEMARGRYCAVMAADLQEPPELVRSFVEVLSSGEADVVFGVRSGRSDGFISSILSESFWGLYRRLVMPDIPKGGVDIFGCNQLVRQAVLTISEPNSSLVAQLFWVGFKRKFISYERRRREKGKSAWKFSRRFRYMLDSIFSFSDLPVIFLLWGGTIGVIISIIIGIITLCARLSGYIAVPGYATIILLQVFSSSLLLLTQGIIASYLWRTFENTKKRPLSLVHIHTRFNDE
jgi:glycosyltransferase involved in cell wall biosynthesis